MSVSDSIIEGIRRDVGRLSKVLFEHILRVEEIAVGLAETHALDVQWVRTAALLHDMARATRPEELTAMAKNYGIAIGPLETRMPIFLHGPVAAALAQERYGIEDSEILEAVRAHTTGLAGMGPVARAVFLADKLDPTKDRRYPFNSEVREVAKSDLNQAIRLFLDGEIAMREAGGGVVHPSSVELRNELLQPPLQPLTLKPIKESSGNSEIQTLQPTSPHLPKLHTVQT